MHAAYETSKDFLSCRRVFQAVILQAIRDALITRTTMTGSERINKRNARQWLQGDSDDFREVCYSAGVDPNMVAQWWAKTEPTADAMTSIRDGLLVAINHKSFYAPRKNKPKPKGEPIAAE